MRKLPIALLVLAGVILISAWAEEATHNPPDGPAALVARMVPFIPSDVLAQDELKFREVPAESLKRIETPSRRRGIEPIAPDDPDLPSRMSTRAGDVVRIGHNVHVEEDERIEGDVVVMGADVVVDGHVEGDVVAMGGDLRLNSTARVDGDVACIGGHLEQEDGAVIRGQRFTATGFRDFARQQARSRRDAERSRWYRSGDHLVGTIVRLLVLLGVAWAFAALAPGRTRSSLEVLKRQPATALGVGALVFALIIPSIVALALVVAILCITIIGIPLALAALFGYVLFLVLMFVWGFAVVSSWVGEWALTRGSTHTATASGAAMPPGSPVAAQPPSLVQMAVIGALILGGARLAAEVLKSIPPLHGIGVLIGVLSWIAMAVAITLGGGAWLRNEFTSGLLGRLWRGRRGGGSVDTPPPTVTPAPADASAGATAPPAPPSLPPYGTPPPPSAPSPPSDPGTPSGGSGPPPAPTG